MTVTINLDPKRIGTAGADGALRRPLSGPSPSSAVAQPSWLRVHGASQLRVSDRFFRKPLRDCLKVKFCRSSSSSSSNLGLKKAPKLSVCQYVSIWLFRPCHLLSLFYTSKTGCQKGTKRAKSCQKVTSDWFIENLSVDARLTASAPSSRPSPPVGEKVAAGRTRGRGGSQELYLSKNYFGKEKVKFWMLYQPLTKVARVGGKVLGKVFWGV